MIACYIIYSQHTDKFYIGFTHENVEARIGKHIISRTEVITLHILMIGRSS